MTHEQTDTTAPTGAVSVTETPVYPLYERDDLNPYSRDAALGALLFWVVFALMLGIAGWIEAAL